jgi:tRNA(fMet)-specific endonuclease VapC
VISTVTASELLHGVERARDPIRKARRKQHVEQLLASVSVEVFDLAQARCHARIWAELESVGQIIGPYDLLIAAAALTHGHELATINTQEFRRVNGLKLVDVSPYLKS